MIPVFKPWYGQEEIDAVSEVIRSGWTGLGPKTEQFEKEFGDYLDRGYVVGLNSATAALDMALKCIGIKPGDQVLVPAITFVSTAHVVRYNLAEPVFVDVDPITLNMDIDDALSKINSNTKAIIPVHYSGRPVAGLERLGKALDKLWWEEGKEAWIIEDCAHACGAPVPVLENSIGCFSFHAVKNLSMGEGGAVVFPYKGVGIHYVPYEFEGRAKRLRWLGIDKGTWDRSKLDSKYWWEYSVDEIGLKCHMDDIHAAMGLVQLKKLNEGNRLRRERVRWYRELLEDISSDEFGPCSLQQFQSPLTLPPEDDNSAWHLFCVKAYRRDELSVFLQDNGIATGVHYRPIHTYSCYGNKPTLESAEYMFPYLLTLPLYPDLTREQVEYICDTIKKFYSVL